MIERSVPGAPMRRAAVALLAVSLVALSPSLSALAAQAPTRPAAAVRRGGWSAVRVAKWALLGTTVGLGYYALTQSTRADRAYSELRHLCADARGACTLASGRYADVRAEALYASSLERDHRAQGGILGGQVTLLASAALFVYDLRNVRGPENIPFPGVPAAPAPSPSRSPPPAARDGGRAALEVGPRQESSAFTARPATERLSSILSRGGPR